MSNRGSESDGSIQTMGGGSGADCGISVMAGASTSAMGGCDPTGIACGLLWICDNMDQGTMQVYAEMCGAIDPVPYEAVTTSGDVASTPTDGCTDRAGDCS